MQSKGAVSFATLVVAVIGLALLGFLGYTAMSKAPVMPEPVDTAPQTVTTITDPLTADVSLKETGLGVANFGASINDLVPKLSALYGAPTKDTGWINGFSEYGTCPSEQIRVYEWNRLKVFFGDTPFGKQKFFSWTYSDYNAPEHSPELSTPKGVGLGMSKADVVAKYPGAEISPYEPAGEDFELMTLVPFNQSNNTYLGGTLEKGNVFFLSGGLQCGE